jgi:integrase
MPVYRKGKRDKWLVRIWSGGRALSWVVDGSRRDAETCEAQKRLELETAGPRRAVPTFSDFCVGQYRPFAELRLKPSWWTKQQYMLATLMARFGDERLSAIDSTAIEEFVKKRIKDGLRAASVNNEVRVLKRVLSYARELGIPIRETKWRSLPERNKRPRRAWTEDELERLLARCAELSPDILPMVVFLANTGARRGEALALTWDHVDLERGQILIWPSEEWQPKNGRPREVPISDGLRPWLLGERRSKWVFPSAETGDRYAYWPQKAFDRARAAAGLSGGPHTLRHTFATHFLARCPDLYLLARILGHSDVAVTKLYSHLLPDHLARARNAVSVRAPVGPATVETRRKWRIAAKPYPEPYPEAGRKELSSERDTGFEPATFSLGS